MKTILGLTLWSTFQLLFSSRVGGLLSYITHHPGPLDGRYDHTLEASGLMCGGDWTRSNCVLWSSVTGTWDASTYYHVSWTPDPDIGTYLKGGGTSEARNTTTPNKPKQSGWSEWLCSWLIKPERSQEQGFSLKYYTEYVSISWAKNCQAQVQSQIEVPKSSPKSRAQIQVQNPKYKVQRKGTGTGADTIILQATTTTTHPANPPPHQ